MVCVVCPSGIHRYEYSGVPPVAFAVAVPFGRQIAFVTVVVTLSLAGSLTSTGKETMQFFASVTST